MSVRNAVSPRSALAAAALLASAGAAHAQGHWDLHSWGGWEYRPCTLVFQEMIPQPCGTDVSFVTRKWVPTVASPNVSLQACCVPLAVNTSFTWSAGTTVKIKVCENVTVDVKGDVNQSWNQQIAYQDHVPCGCVQAVWSQDYQIYTVDDTYRYCWSRTGQSPTFTQRRTVVKKVPNGGRWDFYTFAKPDAPCPDCGPNGRRTNGDPAAPAHNPAYPGGFQPQHPNNMPQMEPIPWDPSIHNNPDIEPLMQANGADKQATLDLRKPYADRGIKSAYDLTLFECRDIVVRSNEMRSAPFGLRDQSSLTVLLTDDIVIKGMLGDIVSDLKKYADIMVNGKSYGDFDGNGARDTADVALLLEAIQRDSERTEAEQRRYDLNGDGVVDVQDIDTWLMVAG